MKQSRRAGVSAGARKKKQALALLAICGATAGWLLSTSAAAPPDASPVSFRPIADFLDRQGAFCLVLGEEGIDCEASSYDGENCFLFVPGVDNFLGWSTALSPPPPPPDPPLAASVDYAGLANKALIEMAGQEASLGTSFSGRVIERSIGDETEVTVQLRTEDALTFVIEGFDFATSPLRFGFRVDQVAEGAEPALASSLLEVRFTTPTPNAALPDLIELLACPDQAQQELLSIRFNARAEGTAPISEENPERVPARMHLTQVGLLTIPGQQDKDMFPVEIIKIRKVANK